VHDLGHFVLHETFPTSKNQPRTDVGRRAVRNRVAFAEACEPLLKTYQPYAQRDFDTEQY